MTPEENVPKRRKRKKVLKEDVVKNIRFEREQLEIVQEIAAVQSIYLGRCVSPCELIREAVRFFFDENERMRECFRRSRASVRGLR